MTHDTPGHTDEQRRWCPRCDLSVEPSPGPDGPECPACGATFD